MCDSTLKTSTLSLIIGEKLLEKKRQRRADQLLSGVSELPSRSQLKYWFSEGRIKRGGEILSADSKLSLHDEITIEIREEKPLELEPRPVPFETVFEDESLIVIHKPSGYAMHPGAGRNDETTIVHGLLDKTSKLSDQGGEFRPGIIHRLDKETEGLVVVAKDNKTHAEISRQFAEREVKKKYWALCYGKFPNELVIDLPIGRHPQHRKKMFVTEIGRPSRTDIKLLSYHDEGYSWVECDLKTGRTHQIRVHLSHKRHPIVGDSVYARARQMKWSKEKETAANRLCLIAFYLSFKHPKTKERMEFKLEPPQWLRTLTNQ